MIRYRPNVALILQRADGRILIGERLDVAGAWQFPQGGVDAGESIEQALAREMWEELCLKPSDYRVVNLRGPYRYEFEGGRLKHGFGGQEQTYFLAEFIGNEAQILADPETPEFSNIRWIRPAEFCLDWVPGFKRPVYRRVLEDFFKTKI